MRGAVRGSHVCVVVACRVGVSVVQRYGEGAGVEVVGMQVA